MQYVENSSQGSHAMHNTSVKSALCLLVNNGAMRILAFDQSAILIYDDLVVCGENHVFFNINEWIYKLAATEGLTFASLRVVMLNEQYMILPSSIKSSGLPDALKPYWMNSECYKLEEKCPDEEHMIVFPIPESHVFSSSYPFKDVSYNHLIVEALSVFKENLTESAQVCMYVIAQYIVLALYEGSNMKNLRMHAFVASSDVNYNLIAMFQQKRLDPHTTLLQVFGELDFDGKLMKDIGLFFSRVNLHKLSVADFMQRLP